MSSPVQLQSQLSAIDVALSVLRQSLAAAVPGSTDQTQLSIAIFDLEQQRSDVQTQLANFTQAPDDAPLSQLAAESAATQTDPGDGQITTAPAPGAVENIGAGLGLLDPQQRAEIITPAPVTGAPGLLDPQQQAAARIAAPEPVQDFVTDPDTNELIPSDSDRAAEIRAEEAAAPIAAPEPVQDFVTDPDTNELIPSDSDRAAEIRAEAAAQEQPAVFAPAPVPSGEWTAVLNDGTGPGDEGTWYVTNESGEVFQSGITDGTQAQIIAENLSLGSTETLPQGVANGTGLTPEEQAAKEQAAAKANAINQATLNSVYKQGGSSDWRVRLQLAKTSTYFYNVPEEQRGILNPLFATNGVIFPYTPAINTSYKANYEQYDLVHSNYRGVYYKNSRVDDLNIRGTFTAQDTNEANYLLAVIHFFRSVTKMFYGQDAERGTPPPLVFLSGLGPNQFFDHPCVISNFQYNLPDNVDYIRGTSVNNYGTDLLSRRTASKSSGLPGLGATSNRLLNAGLAAFTNPTPAPPPVVASVNNMQLANYVPTKMEIDLTLIPVQTRSQVSKQFNLKGFANGDLIKGGFW